MRVPSSSPEHERLAGFAAGALAVMGGAAVLLGLAVMFVPGLDFSPLALFGGAALFLVAYYLNRSDRYRAAVALMLFAFAAVFYVNLLAGERSNTVLVLSAVAAAAGVAYVDLLVPEKRMGLLVEGLLAATYLVLPLIQPVYSLAGMVAPVAGILIVGLLHEVDESRRTGLTAAQQAEPESVTPAAAAPEDALQEENSKLQQQLLDLGIELQATVDEYERVTTEVVQAREAAERANFVKTAFLASMSHELRTPLNAIINLTKFVVDGDLGPVSDSQQEALREVFNSGKHLLNLINDVLDMSKIESGSLNLFVEEDVDLSNILHSVDLAGEALLVGKPVELTMEIADDLPLLRADRQRVTQILLNILSNACKFTNEGSIKLRAYQSDDDVVVSVQDTGPGIAPEDISLVFDAFKQTDTGLRHGGGTGLGMPISRSLAEAHGGKVWAESELGKGSTFFVSLPVKSQELVPMFSESQEAK